MTALNWIRDRATEAEAYTLDVEGQTYTARTKTFAGFLPRGMERRVNLSDLRKGELVHEAVLFNHKTLRCEYTLTEYAPA